DDNGAEAEAARFLAAARLPDLALARALDRLARDEDAKTHKLGAVDYRSLGVRQLGSIYEGLLEFRLRVAREEMAIVAGKKKSERLVPLAEARRKELTIVHQGRGEAAREKILPSGTAYLENDKGERRATGSYYTPDYVVEYIVAQTIGPLIKEKLEALRPDLRQAERWHRKMSNMAEAKGEPRAKYETGPAVDGEWRLLVDEVFDLKVLDPAMGSGHFLVEVVDFVTDKILNFLSAFPWNPVDAHLESVRATILGEMEEQGIAIDDKRLTPVNLLKRHVLKRCVYGVDLNPMAVELAKVSLWLDCFTLGAPLSFLDHHLRCGNSILGVEVNDVREALEGTGMEARSQLLLFGSRFAGLKLATAGMIAVGGMPDVTSAQIRESRSTYRSAANALEPFVRILDVYSGHWFLDPAADPDEKSARRRKPEQVRQGVVDLLKDPQVEHLLNATSDAEAERALATVKPADRRYLEDVGCEADRRRFFHWDVEFPEVFYKPPPGREATVERLPEAGFDAVVGNPPWVRQEGLREMKRALDGLFPETYASEADVYVYLLTRGVQVLRTGGRFGMILQNKWFKAEYAARLRRFLNAELRPLEVIDFGHAPLFDADTFPCILLLEKPEKADAAEAAAGRVDFFNVDRKDLPGIDLAAYGSERRGTVPRRRLRPQGWELLPEPVGDLVEKIRGAGVPLKEYVGTRPYRGILTGYNKAFLIDQATRDRLVAEDPGCEDFIKPFVRGENIQRWHTQWGGDWMVFARRGIDIERYPAIKAYLEEFRDKLEPRPREWNSQRHGRWAGRKAGAYKWYELQDTIDYFTEFEKPKIIYQDIGFHSAFSYDDKGLFANNTCYLIPNGGLCLLACLNSSLTWFLLGKIAQQGKDAAFRLHNIYVEQLPIPQAPDSVENAIATRATTIMASARDCQMTSRKFLSSLLNSFGATRISRNLEFYWSLDVAGFLDAFRAARKGNLSSAKQSRLCDAFAQSRTRIRELRREICRLEIELHHRVFELYDLTREEIELLRRTAPPRDPLLLAEAELALLEAEPR
ncbi:MAG: hypothetical protein GY856_23565, partial [bacterium]|nr:hypothetical protein [bacterium]